jgi:hypothetical protein
MDKFLKSILTLSILALMGCATQGTAPQSASFLNEVSIKKTDASGPYYFDREQVNDFTLQLD